MEMVPRDRTVQLIKEYLPEIGIELPIKDKSDLEEIAEFFEEMEVSLATDSMNGGNVDREFLGDVCRAFDDLNPNDIGDFIDIDKLNERLGTL